MELNLTSTIILSIIIGGLLVLNIYMTIENHHRKERERRLNDVSARYRRRNQGL